MKLAIVEKKTFLAGLQCTVTSSCAIKGAYYEVGYCGKKTFLAGLQCTLTSSCAKDFSVSLSELLKIFMKQGFVS